MRFATNGFRGGIGDVGGVFWEVGGLVVWLVP